MRVPLVAANWKMHGSSAHLDAYLRELGAAVGQLEVDVALFPPGIYLRQAVELAASRLIVGAQNVSEFPEGAFTGEVSASMLDDVGCRMTLVGHSERRTLFAESDEQVANKFVALQEKGITPVLCVGESLAEREKGATMDVVARQIEAVIAKAGIDRVCEAVIAYEPVWAIGTGRTASPEQAQEVHLAIRTLLGGKGLTTRILYGGSVKAANAGELFAQPDIDGGLVGGASLDAKEFFAICQQAMAT